MAERIEFDDEILRHIDAAYNLARWLVRDPADADDVVQESYVRALKYKSGFGGTNLRAWLLSIVRNTCYTHLSKHHGWTEFDELAHGGSYDAAEADSITRIDAERLKMLLFELPAEYREILVLREFEDLSYREISEVADIPVGTVMSRIARARKRLRTAAAEYMEARTTQ